METGLEVDASDELDQPPTWIISRRRILIGVTRLSEGRVIKVGDGVYVSSSATDQEVDVVEGIQEFGAELEVNALGNLDPLDYAQVELGEHWAVEHQVAESALANIRL